MGWLWTWGDQCFGCQDGDDHWTFDGRYVSRFYEDEIYTPDGQYLGEIMSGNRLITNKSKKSWRRGSFITHAQRAGYTKYADYAGYAVYAGYEDFPKLENQGCHDG